MGKVMMMLAVLLLLLGLAGPASADVLTDITRFTATGTVDAGDLNGFGWGDVNWLSGPKFSSPYIDYVSWTHHFASVPNILSGTIAITFYDDETDQNGFFKIYTKEFGLGWGEDWSVDFGEVNAGTNTYSLNVAFLADGIYSATVKSVGGDFGIRTSELNLTYTPDGNNHAVPEPGALMLLGSGLVGLVAWGRKKVRK